MTELVRYHELVRYQGQTLEWMADHINTTARQAVDARRELCIAVYAASLKFANPSKFLQWAVKNLRQPNGLAWSAPSIGRMISFGKHPERLEIARAKDRANKRSDQKFLAAAKRGALPVVSPQKQAKDLLEMWQRTSEPAKLKFLGQLAHYSPWAVDYLRASRAKRAGIKAARSK